MAFGFSEFFYIFQDLLDRELNQSELGTWLLNFDQNYSVLGEDAKISPYQINKIVRNNDPLGRIRNRVAEYPIKDLIEYFRKEVVFYREGKKYVATTKDPSIVIETFAKKISQDKDLPKATKERLLQYADVDTKTEFLASLFFFSVTERVPLIPDVLAPNIPRCLPQKLWLSRKKQENALQKLIDDGAKEIFVIGEGGLGKTEFITNFISKKRSPYRFYFTTFKGTMRDTILQLDFIDWEAYTYDVNTNQKITKPVSQQYEEKLHMLRGFSPKTFLVIDNFDGDAENLLIDPCLRELEDLNMRLIFTTRMPLFQKDHIEITKFSTKELLRLMHLHTGDLFDDADLEKIIDQVDSHTLLVDLIARLLSDNLTDIGPDEILTALQDQKWEHLTETVSSEYNRDGEEKTILGHLLTLFDVSHLSDDASYVLSCTTLLPVEGLNSKVFLQCLGTDKKWLSVVRSLQRSGWITTNRQNTRLSVHPLVREACLKCKKTTPGWERNYPFIYEITVTSFYPESYQLAIQLQAVVTQICCTIMYDHECSDLHAEMYLMIGHLYGILGDYEAAHDLIDLALVFRNDLPDNHISVSRTKSFLAIAKQSLGMYSEAYDLFLEVLKQRQQLVEDGEQLDLGPDYHNLANALESLGRYEESLSYALKSLELAKEQTYMSPVQFCRIYRQLSRICGAKGDYSGQYQYARKAYEYENEFRKSPLERMFLLGTLCDALVNNKKFDEALVYADSRVQLSKSSLPPRHIESAHAYQQHAEVLAGLGQTEAAITEMQSAIALLEEALPSLHPGLGRACFKLGEIFKTVKKYSDAQKLFKQAQACFEKAYPSEHTLNVKCKKALTEVDSLIEA